MARGIFNRNFCKKLAYREERQSRVSDKTVSRFIPSKQPRVHGAARARASAYSSEWARLVNQESAV